MASNTILVLCYSRCSTCKKALKWLDDHHIAYESRDIKEENPQRMNLQHGMRVAAFLSGVSLTPAVWYIARRTLNQSLMPV